MQPTKSDIPEARFIQCTTQLIYCTSLRQRAKTIATSATQKEQIQHVIAFSKETDALVVELSSCLGDESALEKILARHSNEALFVLEQRYKVVLNYLHSVNVGEVLPIPEKECDFFQFALIELLAFST